MPGFWKSDSLVDNFREWLEDDVEVDRVGEEDTDGSGSLTTRILIPGNAGLSSAVDFG